MLWHDKPYAPIFEKYNRSFGHLCLGDPSRNSTGVLEKGFNYSCTRVPLRKSIIPTITIVDGTIEKAPEKVEEIIRDAKAYAQPWPCGFNKYADAKGNQVTISAEGIDEEASENELIYLIDSGLGE